MNAPCTFALECSAPTTVLPRGIARRLRDQLLAALGPDARVITVAQRDWASVTFTGTRYSFYLRLPVADAAPDLDALAEHEFTVANVVVADCAASIEARARDAAGQMWLTLCVELLTIADQ